MLAPTSPPLTGAESYPYVSPFLPAPSSFKKRTPLRHPSPHFRSLQRISVSPLAVAYAYHRLPAATKDIEPTEEIEKVKTANNEFHRHPRGRGCGAQRIAGKTYSGVTAVGASMLTTCSFLTIFCPFPAPQPPSHISLSLFECAKSQNWGRANAST